MLECELCDYLTRETGNKAGQCKLTGHVFAGVGAFEREEYPCRHSSYQEYLLKEPNKPKTIPAFEADDKRVYTLIGNDWMMIYKRLHPVASGRR